MSQYDYLMQTYKQKLNLSPQQSVTYENLHRDLLAMQQTQQRVFDTINSFGLEAEYGLVDTKEASFQIRHLSEQVSLDIKKALKFLGQLTAYVKDTKPIDEIGNILIHAKEKVSRQDSHLSAIEKLQMNLAQSVKTITKAGAGLITNQFGTIEDKIKSGEFDNVQIVSDQELKDLRIENNELKARLDIYRTEITQKQLMLTQRENQEQDLLHKLKMLQSLTSRSGDAQIDERWRVQLETLVYLSTRFLNKMRKLQKVVHKKIPNVNQEKSEFERAKKDLELTLSSVSTQLQSQHQIRVQPVSSDRRQSSNNSTLNDRATSSLIVAPVANEYKASPSKTLTLEVRAEKQIISNLKKEIELFKQREGERELQEYAQMLTIKSQVEAVHRMQSEWVLSTYRVETLSDRLASVIQKHHQMSQIIKRLRSQHSNDEKTIKKQSQELASLNKEFCNSKAEFTEQLKSKQKLMNDQIEKILNENLKLKQQLAEQELSIEHQNDENLSKLRQRLEDTSLENSVLQMQIKSLENQLDEGKSNFEKCKQVHQQELKNKDQSFEQKLYNAMKESEQESESRIQMLEQKTAILIDQHRLQLSQNLNEYQNAVNKTEKQKQRIEKLESEKIQLAQSIKQLESSAENNKLLTGEAQDEHKKTLSKYQQLLKERDEDKQEVQVLKSVFEKRISESELKHKSDIEKLETQIQTLIVQHGEAVQDARQKISKIQNDQEALQKEKDQIECQAERDLQSMEQKYSVLKTESDEALSAIQQKYSTCKQELFEVQELLQQKDSQLQQSQTDQQVQSQQELNVLQQQLKQKSSEVELQKRTLEELTCQFEKIEFLQDSCQQELTDNQVQIKKLQKGISQRDETITQLELQNMKLTEVQEMSNEQLSQQREEVDQLIQQVSALKLNHSSEREILQSKLTEELDKTLEKQSALQQSEQTNEELKAQIQSIELTYQAEISKLIQKIDLQNQQHQAQILELANQTEQLQQFHNDQIGSKTLTHQNSIKELESQHSVLIKENSQIIKNLNQQVLEMEQHIEVLHEQEQDRIKQFETNLIMLQNFEEQVSLTQNHNVSLEAKLTKVIEANQILQQSCDELESELQETRLQLTQIKHIEDQVTKSLKIQIYELKCQQESLAAAFSNQRQVFKEMIENFASQITSELSTFQQKLLNENQQLQSQNTELSKTSVMLQIQVQDKDLQINEFQARISSLAQNDVQDNYFETKIKALEEFIQKQIAELEKQTAFLDILQKKIANLDQENLMLKSDLEHQDVQKSGFVEQITSLQKQVNEFRTEANSLKFNFDQIMTTHRKEISNLKQKHECVVAELQTEYFEPIKQQNKELLDQLQIQQQESEILKQQNLNLSTEKSKVQQQLGIQSQQSSSTLEQLKTQISQLVSLEQVQKQQIEQLQGELSQNENQILSLDQEVDGLQIQLARLKDESTNKIKVLQLSQQQQEIAKNNDEQNLILTIQSLKSEMEILKQNYEAQIKSLTFQLSQKSDDLNETSLKIDNLQNEKQELVVKVQSLIQNLNHQHSSNDCNTSTQLDKYFEVLESEVNQLNESQSSQIMQLQQQQEQLQQELIDRDLQLSNYKMQLLNFENQNETEIIEIQRELQTTQNKMEQQKNEMHQLKEHLKDIENEKIKVVQQLKLADSQIEQVKQENQSLRINVETKLGNIQRQLARTVEEEVFIRLQRKMDIDLAQIKSAYLQESIVKHSLNSDYSLIESWNDIVECVAQIIINDDLTYIVQTIDAQIHVIKAQNLSQDTQMYLQAYSNKLSGLIVVDEQQEVQELRQFIKNLSREVIQFRKEYSFESSHPDAQNFDEIKQFQLRIKELQVQNAALRLQVIKLTEEEQLGLKGDCFIKTARNFVPELDDSCGEDDKQNIQNFSYDDFNDANDVREVVEDMNGTQVAVLEQRLNDANIEISMLQQRLAEIDNNQNEQDDKESDDDHHLLDHVKGTLIQYLKLTPLTDKANEELLKIIFSMMKVTSAESNELLNARMVLKGSNKIVAQAIQNMKESKANNSSKNNISNQSSEGKAKSGGFMGLFNRQKSNNDKSKELIITAQAPQPAPSKK